MQALHAKSINHLKPSQFTDQSVSYHSADTGHSCVVGHSTDRVPTVADHTPNKMYSHHMQQLKQTHLHAPNVVEHTYSQASACLQSCGRPHNTSA